MFKYGGGMVVWNGIGGDGSGFTSTRIFELAPPRARVNYFIYMFSY